MLRELRPQLRAGVPIVGLEPSCVAAFRDELPGLLPKDLDAKRLEGLVLTLSEFLQEHASDWDVPKLDRRAIVHGHCHQEATVGMDAERKLYERMGLDFEILDSGCCGLAGSFGFENGHHEISVDIAEQRLLPAVREAGESTLIVADGFSCKTQIEELSERRALHTAQLLEMALDHGPAGVAGTHPEEAYPDVVLNGGLPKTAKVAGAVAAAIGAGVAISRARR
jgi:Fe-S oxidoreductase